MRVKLGMTVLLFLLPFNVYGSKDNQKDGNLTSKDISNGKAPDTTNARFAENTSGKAVKTVVRREATELTGDNDYWGYPPCGDKPMSNWYTCYCGNITLSGVADLSDGEYHCCVSPVEGQDQAVKK